VVGRACDVSGHAGRSLKRTRTATAPAPTRSFPMRQKFTTPPPAAVPASQWPLSEAQWRGCHRFIDAAQMDAPEIHRHVIQRPSASGARLICTSAGDAASRPYERISRARARRAIATLEMAAFAAISKTSRWKLGEALILPWRIAAQPQLSQQIPGGRAAGCARPKPGDMPMTRVFSGGAVFLNPAVGSWSRHV